MPEIYHVISGRRYRIAFAPLRTDHGICTDPKLPGATITIADNLAPDDELETILHESLHAAGWWLSEEWIDTAAADLAALLLRLGYRKQ